MSTIQLVEVIVGIGNPVHTHVRRTNEINPDSNTLDRLVQERMTGGITPSTLNELSILSGGLSHQHQGEILLSDGWNTKRGLASFRFIVSNNAVQQTELSVLGYLTGGGYSDSGIEGSTMFVPVRSWGVIMSTRQDLETGLPVTQSSIGDSQQFLLGNEKDIFTTRPRDIVNNVGILSSCATTGIDPDSYCGDTSQDLYTFGVIMSKTENLDPTFCAKEILGSTINAMSEALSPYGNEDSLTAGLLDSISRPGLNEINPNNNDFVNTMQASLGALNMAGFQGYSFEEIISVFDNLPDVLNLTMLSNTYHDPEWLMTSSEYGSSGYAETIACEVAALTVHALTKSGLSSVEFVASNNASEFGGINSENGLAFHMGSAMPLLQYEQNLVGRVETFKDTLSRSFFARYSPRIRGGFSVGINASCYMFGETRVTVVVNGKAESERTYVNATYLINLTSTNIAGSAKAIDSARHMMLNIQEHVS